MPLPASDTYIESIFDGLEYADIKLICKENPSFAGYLRGYFAERKLKQYLETVPGVTDVIKIRDHDRQQRADLQITYLGKPVLIEAKSFAKANAREDLLEGGWSSTFSLKRTGVLGKKEGERSVHVPRGQFDVLALNHLALNGKWEFSFIHNKYLPEAEERPGYLKSSVRMNPDSTPCLHRDISRVLKELS